MRRTAPLRGFGAYLLFLTTAACTSTGSNEAVVERVFDEVWSQGRYEVVQETHTPDYTWRENRNTGQGSENYLGLVTTYRTGFPDLEFDVQRTIAQGDLVVVHWIARGTHTGDLAGVPPTGNRVETAGITICRMVDGRAAEEWTTWDEAGMLRQLGLMP